MPKRVARRAVRALIAVLALGMLCGLGLLLVRLAPYAVARYWGAGADLRGAVLIRAPLASANLQCADLRGADLRGADLSCALLGGARLQGADLRAAKLRRTVFCPVFYDVQAARALASGRVRQVTLPIIAMGARCDRCTRWPQGYDPQRQGVIMVK
jgi:hypothetical protein